jgi:uncharacterized RDD family membrane protein YckC
MNEREQHFAASAQDAVAGQSSGNQDYWRQEVISRVQLHRARRRKRSDPDGSLSLDLDFPAEAPEAREEVTHREPPPLIVPRPEEVMPLTADAADLRESLPEPAPMPELKILRFPRPAHLPLPATQRPSMTMVEMELPAPVRESPRIVYAAEIAPPAEQMELLPSFDDIRLDAPEVSLKDELELSPCAAPLGKRAIAGLVDAGIVLATTAALAYAFGIFIVPNVMSAQYLDEALPSRMVLPCLLATGGVLWLALQYLFLVYGEGTPGMLLSGLQLRTFAGERASLFARRCRALACGLSLFSVGLGYAWALVDEDQLGWHDRMTGTCLRSTRPAQTDEADLPY